VDIKTSIINHEDSISVSIDMTLASDVHIPNVTMMMQRTIKNSSRSSPASRCGR
jgi:hypothetical protein